MRQFKNKLVDLYLSWVNDFITFSKFAAYYGLSEHKADKVIRIGKAIHEERVREYKISQSNLTK